LLLGYPILMTGALSIFLSKNRAVAYVYSSFCEL